MVKFCNPSHLGGKHRRISDPVHNGQKHETLKAKGVVYGSCGIVKPLSSNPSTAKTERKRKGGREEEREGERERERERDSKEFAFDKCQ
jgi:hypothetical protein